LEENKQVSDLNPNLNSDDILYARTTLNNNEVDDNIENKLTSDSPK